MTSLRMGRIAVLRGRLLAAVALVLALGAVEARADHVFTLSDVTFNDGGTATGTFTTNDALSSLVSFDIITSPGTNIGFEYTPATANSSSTALPFILTLNTPPLLDNILELTFTNLTVAGAPITIGDNDSFEQTLNARRVVVSGQVVAAGAVPEPSSLVMGGVAAIAGLGIWARRRRAG
jgi:PEP-CTERM motif